jgi:hypothetical protein
LTATDIYGREIHDWTRTITPASRNALRLIERENSIVKQRSRMAKYIDIKMSA